jgi:hypothetical protein
VKTDELLLEELLEELDELLLELEELLELDDEELLEELLELDDEELLEELLELDDELEDDELEEELLDELEELLEPAVYVKALALLGALPSDTVTVTVTDPTVSLGGVLTVTVLESTLVKSVPATPPKVTPVATSRNVPETVTNVPPSTEPEPGVTVVTLQEFAGVQMPASAGTAMLVTTGTSAAVMTSIRRREIGSSAFVKPRTRRPVPSSSFSATRTSSSASSSPGRSTVSWTIDAMSDTDRLPSASRHTSAAVRLSRCAVWPCWS